MIYFSSLLRQTKLIKKRVLTRFLLVSSAWVGATFQIDSCQYNADEDLWHIQAHATDQDHPDTGRTLINLATVYVHRGDPTRAKEYLKRAENIVSRTVSANHPLMISIKKTKGLIQEEIPEHVDVQV